MYQNFDVDFKDINIEDNTKNSKVIDELRKENLQLERKLEEKDGYKE